MKSIFKKFNDITELNITERSFQNKLMNNFGYYIELSLGDSLTYSIYANIKQIVQTSREGNSDEKQKQV